MAVDPYRQCPCGSGKKMKFCCSKDILSDLDQVLRAIEGDQYLAALDQVAKLVDAKGARPALLHLKANLEMAKGNDSDAEKTLQQLAKAAPHLPGTLSLMALLEVRRGNLDEAVDLVQQAMEYVDREFPASLYSCLFVLSQALLTAGDVLAARGHLSLQAALTAGEDERPLTLLMGIDRAPEVFPLLKEDFWLAEAPAGVPWEGEFKAALNPARGGTWRAAAESLLSLSEKVPDQPEILRNIATLQGWLGQSQKATEMWHRLAALPNLPLEDAVAVEALAQYLDDNIVDVVQRLRYHHPVRDMDRLMERLLSDRRVDRLPVDPRELAQEGQPPPRGVFLLLDRPASAATPATPWRELPRVLGTLSAYGKETDREARLEITLDRVPDLESHKAIVTDIVGEWAGAPGPEEVREQVPLVEWLTAPVLHLPEGMSVEQASAALAEYRRDAILHRWPDMPLAAIASKRPLEVAGDPSYRVRLMGALLLLELASDDHDNAEHFRTLRSVLSLPPIEPLDPSGLDVSSLSLVKLMRLDVPRLSDEQLLVALQRSVLKDLRALEYRLGGEALSRSTLEQKIDHDAVYRVVVRTSPDSATSLQWIEQARRSAEKRKVSPARWLLVELSARIVRGEGTEANRILGILRTRHANEPGIAEGVKEILDRLGLRSASQAGAPAAPTEAAPPPVPEPKKIWTPDQASAPSPAGTGQSKLWIPGMD